MYLSDLIPVDYAATYGVYPSGGTVFWANTYWMLAADLLNVVDSASRRYVEELLRPYRDLDTKDWVTDSEVVRTLKVSKGRLSQLRTQGIVAWFAYELGNTTIVLTNKEDLVAYYKTSSKVKLSDLFMFAGGNI